MKNNRIKLLIAFCVVLLSSCLRLDDNLFNPDTTITAYKFDDFKEEVDFTLDHTYFLSPENINLFTINSNGNNIYAVYVGDTTTIAEDTVIVYFHGNKWHMDFYWPRTKLLAHTGGKKRYGILTFDYQGYGLSEGKATEETMYEDSYNILRWLKQKGLSSDRLIFYGFSLGSAPAIKLSAEPGVLVPSKIILENPFASSAVMVQDASVLAMPREFFADVKINNAELIKNVSQPLMWIHGIEDDFLSIKTHGELVFRNYNGIYSEPHRISGADHGSVPNTWGFKNYTAAIERFIVKIY
jgi:pimeloyl-ACP methyl ester carboxylesterase